MTEQEQHQRSIEIANALAAWIDSAPLPATALHPVYDAHVLLMEYIRQEGQRLEVKRAGDRSPETR